MEGFDPPFYNRGYKIMGSKKLIKKGFISVISACLVFSSSFNSYALSQEVETQGIKYTLELEGVAEAGEELTATFSPSDKVGGMQTVIYTWFIDDEQVYFDWGIEKENSNYTINKGEVGEVYVIVDFGDLNNINQQLKSNSLMIEKTEGSEGGENGGNETEEAEYTLELTGTPSVGEELIGLFSPYEKIGGEIYYYWWLNGNVVNTDGLSAETTYTVQEEDEGKIYIEAQFENSNSEYMTIKSNTLTIEKSNTEEGEGSDGGENGDTGEGDTGDTGNTDNGADDTGNKDDTGNTDNESTDNKDEAGDTEDKGDTGTGEEDGTGDTGTGEEGSEGGENTGDKEDTDTSEDGSLDDDINISTPSDAEKEENKGDNDNNNSGKDEEDITDNNNSNIDTDNNNSSNSSNSNNSNSHSSSSHSSSKSTNSEVYKWEFVNYKWFWKSNKGNIHKGWLQCPLDGYWYYFDLKEGYMLEGQQTIEGKTYYFQKQEETPSQTYYFEGDTWNYKKPLGGTSPWGSMLNIEL